MAKLKFQWKYSSYNYNLLQSPVFSLYLHVDLCLLTAEQLRKLNVQFVPSEKMPALQYLDSVEKGSVADKAGLRAGDFILEVRWLPLSHNAIW